MPSPVGMAHSEEHGHLMLWLGLYGLATHGVKVVDHPTVILGSDSEPQPDAVLRRIYGKSDVIRRGATKYVAGARS